ncbi:MAG: efflux RND transporter periplasmic adaptor subunit [Bacteroidaceae bacterium]|nr:efflux RND transporter periplasmic adaptor subunit [Bacteroidaceae bacterium]
MKHKTVNIQPLYSEHQLRRTCSSILFYTFFTFTAIFSSCTTSSPQTSDNEDSPSQEVSASDTLGQASAQTGLSVQDSLITQEKHTIGGMVVINPEKLASVTVLMGGTIDKLPIYPGQFVEKGAVIATLSNPEFIELQQNYIEALAQTEYLESEYLRQQKLSDNDAASKKKMQQSKAEYLTMKSRKESTAVRLKQLGINPQTIINNGIVTSISIKSPISGYVADINANLGKYLTVGDCICSIIDNDGLRLLFTIFSKDIPQITNGTKLRVSASAVPNEQFHAVVTSIDPIIDSKTNSLKAYAKLTTNQSRLKMGMYVRAVKER